MAHDHAHSHGSAEDNYFLDQICMVGMSAAFGAICLALYFWQISMLKRMLGEQFHPFILVSGIALLLLSFFRGVLLWIQVGKSSAHAHDHHHDHDHHHEHEHEHDHDHGHEHHHDHEHAHDHAHRHHDHGHDHGHAHGDHSHDFNPVRYIPLLVPIVFFLLGFPNKGPKVQAADFDPLPELNRQAQASMSWLALEPSWPQLALLHGATKRKASGNAQEINFKTLEGAAVNDELRKVWGGKVVKVRGQFVPNRGSDRVFSLARFKIQCCAGDATQLNVPMLSAESIRHVNPNDWILVTGEIEFYPEGNGYRTILRVQNKDDVKKTNPDPDPYI